MSKCIISAAVAAMLFAVGCEPANDSTSDSESREDTPKRHEDVVEIPPPETTFLGIGGRAHHVVYVIDRNGSMIDTFDQLQREMRKSISRLSGIQDFHVIFMSSGEPRENRPRKLVPATDTSKMEFAGWLEEICSCGQTDPIPAIRRAFEVLSKADAKKHGKLIYLVTDGPFANNRELLELIRSANKNKEVQINTYLYGGREEEAVNVLMLIAEENGGTFMHVEPEE